MSNNNEGQLGLGDVFWDLPTWVYYTAGYDLGCIIYVANPTDVEREYALITHTYRSNVLIDEGAIQVHDYAWFVVSPGDFIKLHGTMSFDMSDITLKVSLVERETGEATDSISTVLVTPTTAALPPGWNIPDVEDWLSMLMMIMIIIMMGKMMSSALKEKEEVEELEAQQV